MADNDADKTEAPTPKRRQQARDEGRVARSPDLTAALLLIGITVLLSSTGGRIVAALRDLLALALGGHIRIDGQGDVPSLMVSVITPMFYAMLPLLAGTIGLAIIANFVQVGFHPNLKKIQPKLSFNPMKGFKKIFGGGSQGPVKFAMNLMKLLFVGFVAYTAVHGKLEQIVTIAALSHLQIFELCATIVYDITIRIGVVLLILALLDFGYQKWKLEQDMKMTKQEVKDEMKNAEGDPKIKARRRQIQMQQAMKRIKTTVPTADVIVTNPTHYAIALKYEEGMLAPRVVAKGADFLALKIREIAAEHGIPIIERPPLARALYRLCEVGQEIPEQFYAGVAEILAYVYELSGKSRKRATTAA